jgi:hypothetical protein
MCSSSGMSRLRFRDGRASKSRLRGQFDKAFISFNRLLRVSSKRKRVVKPFYSSPVQRQDAGCPTRVVCHERRPEYGARGTVREFKEGPSRERQSGSGLKPIIVTATMMRLTQGGRVACDGARLRRIKRAYCFVIGELYQKQRWFHSWPYRLPASAGPMSIQPAIRVATATRIKDFRVAFPFRDVQQNCLRRRRVLLTAQTRLRGLRGASQESHRWEGKMCWGLRFMTNS